MSQLDVRQLPDQESLAEAPFPAPRRADFRLHIAPAVHKGIADHAAADTSVEICGVLVGHWNQDADGPFARVTDYIRCDSATSKFAEVTFTHESWAHINQEMDSKYAESRIIGWYHSHPDFGIFLSDRDCFIQENFFSGAGQVAYVVDPVRQLEGVFVWRKGKPVLIPHFWVGDQVIPAEASEKPRHAPSAAQKGTGTNIDSASANHDLRQPLDLSLLLMGICLLLLGYLLASTKSRWDRERIIEGTVAHYGVNKLMRLGFEEELRKTRQRLELLGDEVNSLLALDQSALNEKQKAEFNERRARVRRSLELSRDTLRDVENIYGYTDQERAALAGYIAAKQAELTASTKSQDSDDAAESAPQSDTARKQSAPATTNQQGPPAPSPNTTKPTTTKKSVPNTSGASPDRKQSPNGDE